MIDHRAWAFDDIVPFVLKYTHDKFDVFWEGGWVHDVQCYRLGWSGLRADQALEILVGDYQLFVDEFDVFFPDDFKRRISGCGVHVISGIEISEEGKIDSDHRFLG